MLKLEKDNDLKFSGIPADEISSARRVFGIVRNKYKWSIIMETTTNFQKNKENHYKCTNLFQIYNYSIKNTLKLIVDNHV